MLGVQDEHLNGAITPEWLLLSQKSKLASA